MVSPGVVHAVPRTVAISNHFDTVHFVDTVGKADPEQLGSHGVRYHGPAGGGGFITRNQLWRLFREIAPDVIICHFASGDHFFNAIAWGGCPVAVIAMGHDVLYEAGDARVSPMRRLLTRMALRRSCYISAKSEYLARRIRGFGVKAPVAVNYWGADLEHFSPGDRNAARRELGWEENGIYLLSPRAVEPRLNVDVIVDAFAAVKARFPGARLVILGRSKPDYLRRIQEQIDRLRIRDSVLMLGNVAQDALPVCYRASDAVVSMAQSEGFPNTVLEAMACRVPVVIGEIAQIGELLRNGINALITPIRVDAIVDAVSGLLEDDALAYRISDGGLSTVRKYGDISRSGAAFSEIAGRLVTGSSEKIVVPSSFVFRKAYLVYLLLRKIVTV